MAKTDRLMALLRKDSITVRDVNDVVVPKEIPVTRGVLDKAQAICDLVHEIGGDHYEWYFRLLARKSDPECVVRDIHVPKGVIATQGHVDVPGSDAGVAFDEIKLHNRQHGTDWTVAGYGHSHAGFNSVRHSDTDDRNHAQLASVIWSNTQYREWVSLQLLEGDLIRDLKEGKIIVQGEGARVGRVTLDLPAQRAFEELLERHSLGEVDREKFLEEVLRSMPLEVYEPLLKGFCYSIVVNDARMEPYARIAWVEQRGITDKPDEKRFSYTETKVRRVEVGDDVVVDRDALRAMVKDRIVFPSAARRAAESVTTTAYTALEELGEGLAELLTRPSISRPAPSEMMRQASELAAIFGYRTGEYLSRFRYPDVRYAGYADTLMQGLLVLDAGLTATVQTVGPLRPDGQAIQRPKFQPNWIAGIHGNILSHLGENPEMEMAFLRDYCNGNPRKSIERALQTYVPKFLAVSDGRR